jgi:hypothetical protein
MSGPGKHSRKKVDKRKGVDSTPIGNAKVPRVEPNEIETPGATKVTRSSTLTSKSGEGKSGIVPLLVLLYCHSLLTLLFCFM